MIFDDVDLDVTAQKLVEAITFHTGQVCCDATRWLVHEKIYDRFVDECVDRLRSVRISHQCEADSEMGPWSARKQRERVLGYLEKGVAEAPNCRLRWSGSSRGMRRRLLREARTARRFAR
ncbi:MAG: aldehyde dehydrogenase family protein [Pirellulaceae bacterium]